MVAETVGRGWEAAVAGWRAGRRARLAYVFGVARRRQTYRNVAFLLASLPLGIFYFGFLVGGLVLGFATIVLVVGVPILLLMAAASWGLGTFERELVRSWLGMPIPAPIRAEATQRSPSARLAAHFRDQVTWTNLLYLLLKFPLGVLSFAAAFGVIAVTARLLATPLGFLIPPGDLAYAGSPAWVVVGPALGLLVGFGGLHALNGLAYLSGRFARVMLGPSEAALRAAAAEVVAARERANAERAEQSRRELIVNVSHELRTPTASIRGHVESLLMALEAPDGRPLPPERLQNYLTVVHREAERLAALIDDLLALARAEAGELRLTLGPVDAGEVIAEIHETMEPLAWRERSVTLVKEVPPGLPPVLADRERLAQVLLNLVRNAVTHTPAGGIVSIALAPVGPDRIELAVADTGTGIPPEDLDRIFDRFYRVDASRNRASGGFGLGLAIVRDLVTAMGGEVTAESKLGEGSRFRVTLRVASGQTTFDGRETTDARREMSEVR